jgi:cell division protein ZapA
MPTIQLTVHGRSYDVACAEGEEARVREVARDLDRRVAGLAQTVGQVGDQRLLLMACLTIGDELGEARTALEGLRRDEEPVRRAREERLAQVIDRLASRIEAIAAGLEAA